MYHLVSRIYLITIIFKYYISSVHALNEYIRLFLFIIDIDLNLNAVLH